MKGASDQTNYLHPSENQFYSRFVSVLRIRHSNDTHIRTVSIIIISSGEKKSFILLSVHLFRIHKKPNHWHLQLTNGFAWIFGK